MATLEEIYSTAIQYFGASGAINNPIPSPESKPFIDFAKANITKPLKEIKYNFLGYQPIQESLTSLPDPRLNTSGPYIQELNAAYQSVMNQLKTVIPNTEINQTANSPTSFSLGIPTIVLVGGIALLIYLGRKN